MNLLVDLGEDTAEELALETSEDVAAKIRQLASLLTQAGEEVNRILLDFLSDWTK